MLSYCHHCEEAEGLRARLEETWMADPSRLNAAVPSLPGRGTGSVEDRFPRLVVEGGLEMIQVCSTYRVLYFYHYTRFS